MRGNSFDESEQDKERLFDILFVSSLYMALNPYKDFLGRRTDHLDIDWEISRRFHMRLWG